MAADVIQLIAGLANPGKTYAHSRHNAGSWLIHALVKQGSTLLKVDPKFFGLTAQLSLDNQSCWLLIPTTYMNHSGQSLRALAKFYRIRPQAILVVHDELDLPAGVLRFKQGGGTGGHNGLKDIVMQLGSNDFWRLRIGIGHPGHRDAVHHYVLNSPSTTDLEAITQGIARALPQLPRFVSGQQHAVMQLLHTPSSAAKNL